MRACETMRSCSRRRHTSDSVPALEIAGERRKSLSRRDGRRSDANRSSTWRAAGIERDAAERMIRARLFEKAVERFPTAVLRDRDRAALRQSCRSVLATDPKQNESSRTFRSSLGPTSRGKRLVTLIPRRRRQKPRVSSKRFVRLLRAVNANIHAASTRFAGTRDRRVRASARPRSRVLSARTFGDRLGAEHDRSNNLVAYSWGNANLRAAMRFCSRSSSIIRTGTRGQLLGSGSGRPS